MPFVFWFDFFSLHVMYIVRGSQPIRKFMKTTSSVQTYFSFFIKRMQTPECNVNKNRLLTFVYFVCWKMYCFHSHHIATLKSGLCNVIQFYTIIKGNSQNLYDTHLLFLQSDLGKCAIYWKCWLNWEYLIILWSLEHLKKIFGMKFKKNLKTWDIFISKIVFHTYSRI